MGKNEIFEQVLHLETNDRFFINRRTFKKS